MVKLSDMRMGSKVQVRGNFGMDRAERGLVTSAEEDIKNGRPGISYTTLTSTKWAYLDQVTKVVEY